MVHRNVPIAERATVLGPGVQLIDVRQPDEVAAGTLEGAVNIPLDQLPERIGELDAANSVVLLCRSGARSNQAAEFLTDSGFGDVVNLTGGMLAYNEEQAQ